MSCYLLNHIHIANLAHAFAEAGIPYKGKSYDASMWATLLAKANYDSVDQRYGNQDISFEDYTFECHMISLQPAYDLKPIELIKMAQCFQYQACETLDWNNASFHSEHIGSWHIQYFISKMISKLNGYSSADWEFYGRG